MRIAIGLSSLCCLLFTPALASGITVGQLDDFEDGTVMGWDEGPPSPNPPVNIPDGGPLGAGDSYLENFSAGGFGPGSMMAMFNREQWTGDYLAAGVTSIEADFANFSAEPMYLRIGIERNFGERYASSEAFLLPADAEWHHATFGLSADDLSPVGGIASLDDVLANVQELRIISRQTVGWQGDAIEATLGTDNVLAVPEPASMLALGLALMLVRRR